MPNLFRTIDGLERKPSVPTPFKLPDGTIVEATWAGSAKEEKLDWWLRESCSELAQSEAVTAVATKADDDGELQWGDAPDGAHLFFVLMPRALGKDYRLAKMVTTAATPEQSAHFRHDRFSLFGKFNPDGSLQKTPPLTPPPPEPPAQGELF